MDSNHRWPVCKTGVFAARRRDRLGWNFPAFRNSDRRRDALFFGPVAVNLQYGSDPSQAAPSAGQVQPSAAQYDTPSRRQVQQQERTVPSRRSPLRSRTLLHCRAIRREPADRSRSFIEPLRNAQLCGSNAPTGRVAASRIASGRSSRLGGPLLKAAGFRGSAGRPEGGAGISAGRCRCRPANLVRQLFESTKSTIQQPRTCGPPDRQ